MAVLAEKVFWFENSIWRLNEIKDLNMGSYDTTKMEFIKVQDMNNYKLDKIEYQGTNQIILDQSTLACTGGTITGKIILQGGGGWAASEVISGVDGEGNSHYLESADAMNPNHGRGEITNFTLTVPANTGDTPITWTVAFEDDFDVWYRAYFTQETCNTASTLTLTRASTTVNSPASFITLMLTAERITGLSITSNVEWATITRNGTAVTVTYTKNSGTTPRTATITATGTGVEGTMTARTTITQLAAGNITVNPNTVIIDWNDQGPKSFNITTNDDWTSEITDN